MLIAYILLLHSHYSAGQVCINIKYTKQCLGLKGPNLFSDDKHNKLIHVIIFCLEFVAGATTQIAITITSEF